MELFRSSSGTVSGQFCVSVGFLGSPGSPWAPCEFFWVPLGLPGLCGSLGCPRAPLAPLCPAVTPCAPLGVPAPPCAPLCPLGSPWACLCSLGPSSISFGNPSGLLESPGTPWVLPGLLASPQDLWAHLGLNGFFGSPWSACPAPRKHVLRFFKQWGVSRISSYAHKVI